jgi:hypothetical protein
VSQSWYPFWTANRSRLEWGVGLDWTIPLRTDIYYGRLPAPGFTSDLVNERGQFLGRYRTELRVDYISVPAMFRLPLFCTGDRLPNRTLSDRGVCFSVNALAGPRFDVYLPHYVGGMGDETGWTYGRPDEGEPQGDLGIPIPPSIRLASGLKQRWQPVSRSEGF